MSTNVARRRRAGVARKPAAGDFAGREVMGLGLIALGALLGMRLFLGLSVGPLGGGLETLVRLGVGRAVALAPFALAGAGLAIILHDELSARRPFRLGCAVLGATILLVLASGVLGAGGRPRTSWFDAEVMRGRGGLGGEVEYFITSHTVGRPGTALLVLLGLTAGLVLVTGASLAHLLRRSGHGAAAAGRVAGRGAMTMTVGAVRGSQRLGAEVFARLDAREPLTGGTGTPKPLTDGADSFPDIFAEAGTMPPSPALANTYGEVEPALEDDGVEAVPQQPRPAATATATATAASPARPAARRRDDEDTGPIELGPVPSSAAARGYRPPPSGMLRRSGAQAAAPAAAIADTSRRLVETLGHFGVNAQVTDSVSGPRVTRYELQLAPGTKVSRVTALRDDLAYALAAREEIRILAPIPGKQAVGVEVANPNPALVTLGDIFHDFPDGAGPLVAWLGIDIGGSAVYFDISRMPHVLIAGSTGTGKSVCLNAILASILLRSSPDELRMILIDPKKVELNHYEGIPHLLTPVVTNMKNAAAVLANVVREMEVRYELMGAARARNLRDWNEIRRHQGDKPLPTILVVIDELADLMMVSPAEGEDAIIRLAQKSRAVGIHLVLATQRPSVDVITGMIKANVPSRIAFAVSSQVDSRVILDATGAESLLGQGDMLFRPVGTSRLQRLQGAYVSEEEIQGITDHWRRQGRPELREDLLERPEVPEDDPLDPDADDLLGRAVELVVSQGTASVSLLQRRLGVGYARAGRLVDMMERLGAISGHEGSKPRTVLIGEGDVDRLLRRSGDDEEPGDPPETDPF
ncbi:MAG TPA: DNA translocase FtsK [Miltoncostaeaceae bacterium]|nr:DNA translocase FtsK [Miltoncostaeaceae bacterium]